MVKKKQKTGKKSTNEAVLNIFMIIFLVFIFFIILWLPPILWIFPPVIIALLFFKKTNTFAKILTLIFTVLFLILGVIIFSEVLYSLLNTESSSLGMIYYFDLVFLGFDLIMAIGSGVLAYFIIRSLKSKNKIAT
jgi:hypothetical protein